MKALTNVQLCNLKVSLSSGEELRTFQVGSGEHVLFKHGDNNRWDDKVFTGNTATLEDIKRCLTSSYVPVVKITSCGKTLYPAIDEPTLAQLYDEYFGMGDAK